jgi:acyl-CoA synthetase (AMP-forming)/AMP-acid ligase II
LQINESGYIVSFGKPLQNVRSIIIDENLQEVEHGETGQLCLSGDQLTPGYLNNGMLNINSFFYFPPSSDIIYYKTGDLSFQDGDKNYYYSGRIDNQIKINGYRIELEDIEAIACQVTQRTCIALINDKCINSSIYLAIEGKILENHSDIFKLLSQKLPNYMIPTKIFYIDKFQLTSNMKINRKSLIEEIIYKHPIN